MNSALASRLVECIRCAAAGSGHSLRLEGRDVPHTGSRVPALRFGFSIARKIRWHLHLKRDLSRRRQTSNNNNNPPLPLTRRRG